MLHRLGFGGRLLAIMLLVMLAAVTLGVGVAYVVRSDRPDAQPQLPLPEQAAAIVALIEATPASGHATVLKAVNSDTLAVSVQGKRPTVDTQSRRLIAVEWLVSQYVEAAPGREVIATSELSVRGLRLPFVSLNPYDFDRQPPLRIAIALLGGNWIVFESRGAIGRRVFGLPVGFWIGVLGALVGVAAILAVMREARPLKRLADAVTRFSQGAEPVPVPQEGAPEVKALIGAVNDMQARIASLIRGRTILIGAVSHDIKTFVTRLRLRIEAIPDDEGRAKAIRDLDDMTAIIDDALALGRGAQPPERRELVDLSALVASDIAHRDHSRVTSDTTMRGGRALVDGDPVALRRLVANLVDNAVRFGETSRVTVIGTADSVFLTVDDDGPGIPEAHRTIVFEPFFRADPSRSRTTGGSGLGLAISKQIVEAHGGRIAAEASPLGGARLIVTLPAARRSS